MGLLIKNVPISSCADVIHEILSAVHIGFCFTSSDTDKGYVGLHSRNINRSSCRMYCHYTI